MLTKASHLEQKDTGKLIRARKPGLILERSKLSHVREDITQVGDEAEEVGTMFQSLDLTPEAMKKYWRILQQNDKIRVVFLNLSFHSGNSQEQHWICSPVLIHQFFVTGSRQGRYSSGECVPRMVYSRSTFQQHISLWSCLILLNRTETNLCAKSPWRRLLWTRWKVNSSKGRKERVRAESCDRIDKARSLFRWERYRRNQGWLLRLKTS